jgi:CheY-like chemotaxis protein
VPSAPRDQKPEPINAKFIQALAAKSLETVRLTEALSVSPEDEAARAALATHLSELRQSAEEHGLVHLESAVAEAASRLELESFGPASLVAVRVLAWRYESLASMPSRSGTHSIEDALDPPVLTLSGDVGGEQPLAEASLRGRRILVADDEPEVRWFYVGILRETGARVIEARDGVHALELARDDPPDLILADIVMPRLDGLGLCAAVRREPVLDGVPVVLLSWREDFLHRMRELRAGAQDYLRKEAPARQILDRVGRVLEPLARLEESLKSDREARGDLEELGVSALLRATRRLRPNASIVFQDPWSLFELELHEGHIIGATRTAIDGAVTQGAAAFAGLVGMSSGRYVVTELTAPRAAAHRESLDDSFAQATRRLGVLMTALAAHPDCRVELDQDALGTYVRHSPIGVRRLIARLVAGEPPHVLWESGAGSRSLVDAVLVTLARQGAIRDVAVPTPASDGGPSRELNGPKIQQDSSPVADPLERENIRAQLAVAMHREPANQVPTSIDAIWRLKVGSRTGRNRDSVGFGMEMQTTPRLFGLAFLILLSATVGVLIWRQVVPAGTSSGSPKAGLASEEAAAEKGQAAPIAAPSGSPDLSAFAGSLRAGADASLGIAEGQGVLELTGPSEVSIDIDGVDQGALPVVVALDQGRHAVRYRIDAKSTYRFYYVKSGATRALRVVTRPDGFIDAR